jgi:phage-related minor tail protein
MKPFGLISEAGVQLISAQNNVKQAVAAKDAVLASQEEQIRSLQEELHVTKEELDATRDGLHNATVELENVRAPVLQGACEAALDNQAVTGRH